MDWNNPLRAVSATVDADVLQVLVGTQDAVTGNQLARLSGRSYAQVYAVVRRMTSEGLVLSTRYGRTNTYQLNRDHVLAAAFGRILASPTRIEAEIRLSASEWNPPPDTIAFLGSAARRHVSPDGDVDVLIVRPGGVGKHDSAWRSQVEALTRRIEGWCGNGVRVHEVDRAELAKAARSNLPLTELLRSGARTVYGRRLSIGVD